MGDGEQVKQLWEVLRDEAMRHVGPDVPLHSPLAATAARELMQAAAIAFELEQHVLMEARAQQDLNEELRVQASEFASMLVDLRRLFATSDTEVGMRQANRISALLDRHGVPWREG